MKLTNISPVSGLKPHAYPYGDEYIVNMDGAIELIRTTDTPQAKRIYRIFRRFLARYLVEMNGVEEQKIRERAIVEAMRECGWAR